VVEIDPFLSALTRRLPRVQAADYVRTVLQRRYERKYARSPQPWTVIHDFDGDLHFRINRGVFISSSIYWRGCYSHAELRLFDRFLTPEMIFADIGANQGEFTIFAAKRLTAGRVLTFEPQPVLFDLIQENVRLNGFRNVTVYNLGLSDRDGEAPLYGPKHEAGEVYDDGLASMFQCDTRPHKIGTMNLVTFDRVFRESGASRLDMMKIDAEGAELHVLRGAQSTIAVHRPTILVEWNKRTFDAAGYSGEQCLALLRSVGYEFLVPADRRGTGRSTNPRLVPTDARKLPDFCNILCRHATAAWDPD